METPRKGGKRGAKDQVGGPGKLFKITTASDDGYVDTTDDEMGDGPPPGALQHPEDEEMDLGPGLDASIHAGKPAVADITNAEQIKIAKALTKTAKNKAKKERAKVEKVKVKVKVTKKLGSLSVEDSRRSSVASVPLSGGKPPTAPKSKEVSYFMRQMAAGHWVVVTCADEKASIPDQMEIVDLYEQARTIYPGGYQASAR